MIRRAMLVIAGIALGYAWGVAGRVFVLMVPCEETIEIEPDAELEDEPEDTGVWL